MCKDQNDSIARRPDLSTLARARGPGLGQVVRRPQVRQATHLRAEEGHEVLSDQIKIWRNSNPEFWKVDVKLRNIKAISITKLTKSNLLEICEITYISRAKKKCQEVNLKYM